jgi:hypothetical protein
MEPGEKFIRRILKFVFMILAFVIALVFDEFSFRMGWPWSGDFIIGASMGALALYLLKDLRNQGTAVLPGMRQEFTLPHSYESSEGRAVDPNPKCHLRPMVDPVCNL